MIRVERSRATLSSITQGKLAQGLAELRQLAGQRQLHRDDFKRSVYGTAEIKRILWQTQLRKCCYCEGTYERRFAAVEHFRPKSEALRAGGIREPGYWWLAYHFPNLYFICPNCNTCKGSQFPLETGSRALAPEDDPATVAEHPLLLDPSGDNPELHLTFVWLPARGYQIAPRDGSERGRCTIEVLELDRDDLYEIRHGFYTRTLQPLIERYAACRAAGDQAGMDQISQDAAKHAASDAPFALLARTAFRDSGLTV